AAERSHVAQMRRRDLGRGFPESPVSTSEAGKLQEFGNREPGAEREAAAPRGLLQLGNASKADEDGRRLLTPFHVRQKVRAASDEDGAALSGGQHVDGLLNGRRRAIAEMGKAQHEPETSTRNAER